MKISWRPEWREALVKYFFTFLSIFPTIPHNPYSGVFAIYTRSLYDHRPLQRGIVYRLYSLCRRLTRRVYSVNMVRPLQRGIWIYTSVCVCFVILLVVILRLVNSCFSTQFRVEVGYLIWIFVDLDYIYPKHIVLGHCLLIQNYGVNPS